MAASAKSLDAIALLKADHRTVEELFGKYEKARNSDAKAKVARQVCMELIIHTMIEEEIFYPSLRGEIDDEMLDRAYVEHDGAKVMIAELLEGGPDDEFYDAKVKVLSEEIIHHVHEEERRGDGMFAQAREAEVDLESLGQRMAARKQELKTQFDRTGPLPPVTCTLRAGELKHGQVTA